MNFAIDLIRCFDPGAPQGPRGSLGVAELLSEMLVVHRATLGYPRGSIGSIGDVPWRRPHGSAGFWHPRYGQFKKGGVNGGCDARADLLFQLQCIDVDTCTDLGWVGSCGSQQTTKVNRNVFDTLELLSHCSAPWDSLGIHFPNNTRDILGDNYGFMISEMIDFYRPPRNSLNCDFQMTNMATLLIYLRHVLFSVHTNRLSSVVSRRVCHHVI